MNSRVPLAITLDLHAKVSDRMREHCDIITAYRTYPHTDQIATAERAAALLERTMRGAVKPLCAIARRPMLCGLDDGRTTTWRWDRVAFEPVASEVLVVDAGAAATRDLSRLAYQRVRRPVYPLDLD